MLNEVVVNGDRFTLFLSEATIQKRVKELAAQINRDYEGKIPIFIGILNGSFIFFSDLIREITVDCEVDFLKLSSYGDAKISSGQVKLLKDLNCQVTGRDIIVVEDVVDSGLSIDFMKKLVMKEHPASFRVVTLLLKKSVAKVSFPIDYVGFEIPPEFVIGYGLDYAQKVRNLRAIYRLVPQDTTVEGSTQRGEAHAGPR
jgi:hypoxanthine phosphoribosyltransferase